MLTDIPHMAMHPQGYQAMITDDDDWLKDFATAQLQAHNSPDLLHNGPEAAQAGDPAVPDSGISLSMADVSGQKEDLEASVLNPGSAQVKRPLHCGVGHLLECYEGNVGPR